MKNIKFIPLFLIAFSLMISSCAIDDDGAIIPEGTSVTASLDKTGEIYAYAGNDIEVGFVLSRTITNPAIFSYTLNGVESSINLAIGAEKVTLTIPNFVGETNTIVLTGASALANDIVSVGSTNTSVTFIGVPAINPNGLEVLMDWSPNHEAGNDFDLVISDDPPTTALESSASVSNFENVSFANASYADATYNILVDVWSATDSLVDVKMYVVHPNGNVEIFEAAVPGEAVIYYFVKFNKVTDVGTGDVTYVTTQVPVVPVF